MELEFNVIETCDLKHYVVQINTTGREDEWQDITKPFDTKGEAVEWAKHILDNFSVLDSTYTKGE